MRKQAAIIGMILCLGGGLAIGWFIPALFPAAPRVVLIDTIQSRGTFIVGTSADYPPFEDYYTNNDTYYGFDIDIADLIAAEMGVTVEWVDMDFDSLVGACTAGTIDMIAAAMTYNEDRAEKLAASNTYVTVAQAVIVKNSSLMTITALDNLTIPANQPVGVQAGTVMQSELEALGMTVGVDLLTYPRADALMLALDGGAVKAAYVDEPIYEAFKNTYDIKIIFSTDPEPLALWTRYSEPELLYVMNKVIFEGYQDGTIQDLIITWFG
ncbi:MAG: ABC transporter substrate-binding protein [Promethearchaeota archaeon]